MTPSVRGQLEELNCECETFCRDRSNWSAQWHGTDDNGNPNFLLAYSSAETFERLGGVMFLGTNPGGDHRRAKAHPFRLPFERQRWSSYLDDDWGEPYGKQWPMQIAVRKVAEVLAGKPNLGDRLLRSSPSGNLVPFRSQAPEDLPDRAYKKGLDIGWQLIALTQPSVLVLFASKNSGKYKQWDWLMERIGHSSKPDWTCNINKTLIFRETRKPEGDWPRFVFALPALNTRVVGQNENVIKTFQQRVQHHGLARP